MSHCRASCHSAEVLEVTSPHEWVCLEVFRQFPVYFFVRQLGEVEPAFETFYFQYPKFIFQCLIGTKLDRFQFYFGSLSFGVYILDVGAVSFLLVLCPKASGFHTSQIILP